MSKYVSEIIKDIRSNPNAWTRYGSRGLQKDNIKISNCGNGHKLLWGWSTSIVSVEINNNDVPDHLTWRDKYRLEETFKWWIENASLPMMQK
jgi:hypothetical protein